MTEDSAPRYEFRMFAATLGALADRITAGAACMEVAESREFYLVTREPSRYNIKIRDSRIEIKELLGVERELELWRSLRACTFPLPAAFLRETLQPLLDVRMPDDAVGDSIEALMRTAVEACAELWCATVVKRRCHYAVSGCRVEIDDVRIDGSRLRSIAIESESADAVLVARARYGLEGYENVNFPCAVRRALGLEPIPGARGR
jgi:hypothetical protein